jgi:hypothetical protein
VDYIKFSDKCLRLAPSQRSEHDRKALLHMAEAWLLVAELAQLNQEE